MWRARSCFEAWRGPVFSSFGTNVSRGVTILLKERFRADVSASGEFCGGRVVWVDLNLLEERVRLLCVYAPNDGADRKDFFEILKNFLDVSRCVIMGGDFNCVENASLDRHLSTGTYSWYTRVGAEELRAICSDYGLVDAYRSKYPDGREFTWHRQHAWSRLDRFYLSPALGGGDWRVEHRPCPFSDHSFVELTFTGASWKRGPGYWKCNVTVLEDPDFNRDFLHMWRSELDVV